MKNSQIGIVYLGRMGAGSKLTLTLAKQLIANGHKVNLVLSAHNYDLQMFIQLKANIHLVELPETRLFAFIPFYPYESKKIASSLQSSSIVYFPMPHPRDNQIARFLLKKGVVVGRAIHDYRRHPGDVWPNRLSVRLQQKYSSFVVAHSKYVGDKLLSNKVSIVPLPNQSFEIVYRPKKGLVVFVGRLRKYKGLKILINAWDIVYKIDSSYRLRISGSGRYKLGKLNRTVFVDRRWLSDDEILELISRANCVVFPYLEASQSGLIPILDSLEIPIVVANVGGLVEQVSGEKSLIIRPQVIDVASAILRTISEWEEVESTRTVKANEILAEFLVARLNLTARV